MSPPATVVVRSAPPTYVRPSSPTPLETLDLSVIDKSFSPGWTNIQAIQVFENSGGAAKPAAVIRDALSRALVHYYPIAWRLKEAEGGGDLQVACAGEGSIFVEASVGCSLEAVGYLDLCRPSVLTWSQKDFLAKAEHADLVILLVQVTEFECGGFAVGMEMCHCVCDGLGFAQFFNAVGELARGLAAPTIKPVWQREAIPCPPPTPPSVDWPTFTPMHLREVVFDVPSQRIEELKREIFAVTGRRCSAFEVLVAVVWQCRARSMLSSSDSGGTDNNLELEFSANARHLVRPRPLPEGFYGNCVHLVRTTASLWELARAPLPDVVELVRGAKERLAGEFAEWAARTSEGPPPPPPSYTTLFVVDWSRLGFELIDYGWGRAEHVLPLGPTDVVPVCVLTTRPRPEEGKRLFTNCVEEHHLPSFRENVANIML